MSASASAPACDSADQQTADDTQTPRQHRKIDGSTTLLRAARSGNVDRVIDLLSHGKIDINTSNANGMNALHLAAKEGHADVVRELLNRGAIVDSATKKGNTALHISSLAGHEAVVEALVRHGANVNAQSQNGFSPLYMAAQENHVEIVKFLLASGALASVATEDGFTPLAVALQQGHEKIVSVLLENDSHGTGKVHLPALHIAAKKDDVKAAALLLQNEQNLLDQSQSSPGGAVSQLVNETTKSGFTPLHIASHYGNVAVARLLIECGADVNFRARNAITSLHVAAKWGRKNMVALLLDNGAVIDSRTRDGLTPLHCASRSGHESAVDLLLERGAQVLAKTKNGLGPLHMSVQGDHVSCCRLLLYHKAPIDDVTVDYLTPLHVAAHCGNVGAAKLLLDHHCDVNARALNGFTPLHIAAKKNRIKIVELLLKYGSTVEATTESGLTSLHVVAFMGYMNITLYLLQHGSNPNTTTVRGETALHLAARANQTEILRILLRNGATVDARARERQTALHIASRLGNVENLVLLIQHGASPDAATHDLYTAMHIAAKEGHDEVVRALLENEANQNLLTKRGFTPLHVAAKYGQTSVVKLLLDSSSAPSVDCEGRNSITPLHIATQYNKLDVILALLNSNANTQRQAKNGYTALHTSAKKNLLEVATALLNHGAQPDTQSANGYTSVHVATQAGHVDMTSLLLAHGCDTNIPSKNGLTAMHLAAQDDRLIIAKILLQHGAIVNAQTKSGYTPLHSACHFGHINMIRFLLENGASVNAITKLGYTCLHQAAQQGQLAVINMLLKYGASPNDITHTGLTSLSISQRLGYISVVELLKNITEVQVSPLTMDDKYKVIAPEMMHEAVMSDSEEEGVGDEVLVGDQSFQYLSADDIKTLHDDSISFAKDDHDMFSVSSTIALPVYAAPTSLSTSIIAELQQSSLASSTVEIATPRQYEQPIDASITILNMTKSNLVGMEKTTSALSPAFMYSSLPPVTSVGPVITHSVSPIKPSFSEADCHSMYAPMTSSIMTSSAPPGPPLTSISADNIVLPPRQSKLSRMLRWKSFLVSFMVDARGGAMHGCRHSGVRIVVPPGSACAPIRVTCKLIKLEKLTCPPPLMEGEALASRVLELGPAGAKFLGPIVIEVPHCASIRGVEREVTVLRSDNGQTWREHITPQFDDAAAALSNNCGDDISSLVEEAQHSETSVGSRLVRIVLTELPSYLAIMTRCRLETATIGSAGQIISSSVDPQVQAVFPEGALMKTIKVGLQVQPVPPELVARLLGNRVAVSPVVTVEPRRRKFHKPITLTVPLPKAIQKGMLNECSPDSPSLHLLCSITGGTTPAQWEDITGTTPLSFISEDCIMFTTSVSARFWLMDCQSFTEATKMATELYRELVAVPFFCKFLVFAKRRDVVDGRLCVVCTTVSDERAATDKTFEAKEHFTEVARSRDIEVLEGRHMTIELAGNIVPVTKSGDQLQICFHAFHESRLPFSVRVRDVSQPSIARMTFMSESRTLKSDVTGAMGCRTSVCTLTVQLPDELHADSSVDLQTVIDHSPRATSSAHCLHDNCTPMESSIRVPQTVIQPQLQLADIADAVNGDWPKLARALCVTECDVSLIRQSYSYVGEQALVMLHGWLASRGRHGNGVSTAGLDLGKALQGIGRDDVVRSYLSGLLINDDCQISIDRDDLMSSSKESSIRRPSSSFDEKDLMCKMSESGQSWSDALSAVSSKQSETERVISLEDDMLTPVVEEQSPNKVEDEVRMECCDFVEGMDDRTPVNEWGKERKVPGRHTPDGTITSYTTLARRPKHGGKAVKLVECDVTNANAATSGESHTSGSQQHTNDNDSRVRETLLRSALVETTPVIKVTGDPDRHDDDVFLHNFERNSSYKPTNNTGWPLDTDDVISSCVHAVIQQHAADDDVDHYAHVSVDEMDIDKMFEKTSSTEDSSLCQEHGGPLSPADYTLQVDDDEDDSLSADATTAQPSQGCVSPN